MIASLKKLSLVGVPLVFATMSSLGFAEVPAYVKIRDISYGGPGCPQGSVGDNISPSGDAFTLIFDEYIVEAPGQSLRDRRKSCQLNIDLDFPQGWSFTVATVDYRGYVYMSDRNVSGTQKSTYYFQGSLAQPTLTTNMRGPLDKNYVIRDQLGLNAVVWSPCGEKKSLNIKTELNIQASRGGEGMLTTDSIDGTFKQIYGLQWKRCR